MAQVHSGRYLVTEEAGRMLQGGHRVFLFLRRTKYLYLYSRLPAVRRYIHFRDGYGFQPWVVHFKGDQLRKFFPDCLSYAGCSTFVHVYFSQPLYIRPDQHCAQKVRRFLLDAGYCFFRDQPGTRHGNGSNYSSLPEILIVNLRHGDVESSAKTVLETLDHLPLILKRLGVIDP